MSRNTATRGRTLQRFADGLRYAAIATAACGFAAMVLSQIVKTHMPLETAGAATVLAALLLCGAAGFTATLDASRPPREQQEPHEPRQRDLDRDEEADALT